MLRIFFEIYLLVWEGAFFPYFLFANTFVQGINDLFLPKMYFFFCSQISPSIT